MKNEEGVVMMFILNFDYVLDEESDNSTEKISPASPTKSDQSEYKIHPPAPTVIGKHIKLQPCGKMENTIEGACLFVFVAMVILY